MLVTCLTAGTQCHMMIEYMKADRVSMFNRSPSVSFWGNIPLDEPSADGIQIERTTQTGSIGQTPYGGKLTHPVIVRLIHNHLCGVTPIVQELNP